MALSFIVRFRPTGPWRFGPDSGAREQVDRIFHSDAVYSAVCGAMASLGTLEDWLQATATSESGRSPVRFSSFFPFQRDLLFVAPPSTIWPPPASIKIRYKGARFVPLGIVEALLNEKPIDEDRWQVDGESSCMIPSGWQEGPFRAGLRSNAAVDRTNEANISIHTTACLEFTRDSGLWMMVVFEDEDARKRWEFPLRGALKLLADSGIGGERSRGWGRSTNPKWDRAEPLAIEKPEGTESAYWLLSVYNAAESDAVDWNRGNYSTITRTGRIESRARWGETKPSTVMIAEGSVLFAGQEPHGIVKNIAPEGFPHPVYRSGFAVSIPIPWRVSQ
jgi:CRISPR type III-A-associated RAMP protein Csm4